MHPVQSEMTHKLGDVVMCRACLIIDGTLTPLQESGLEDILVMLLGCRLPKSPDRNWLCNKCIYTLQKVSIFRDLCVKADGVLREYYVSYSEGDAEGKNFLQCQREILYDPERDCLKTWDVELKPIIKEEVIDTHVITEINVPSNYIHDDKSDTCDGDDFQTSTSNVSLNNKFNDSTTHLQDSYNIDEFSIIDEINNINSDIELWKAANLKHLEGKGDPDKNMMVREILMTEKQIEEDRKIKEKDPKYTQSPFKCEPCILGFKYPLSLENHKKKHEPERGSEKCIFCGQRFSNMTLLREHRFINHKLRIRCAICGIRVRDHTKAVFHARLHKGEAYTCQICQAKFTTPTGLKTHTNSKHKPNFLCTICPKYFSSNEVLQKHQNEYHSSSEELKCKFCGKIYKTRNSLWIHSETCNIPKEHYCVECDKYFATQRLLQNHLNNTRTHMDDSKLIFSCDQCSNKYPNAADLRRHIKIMHERKRSYVCSECNASFLSSGVLKKHIKTVHEGYKPPKRFSCHLCDKAFSFKIMLENHVRIHTGEKPFACSQCEWRFTQKAALGTHIRLVHLKMKRNVNKKPRKNTAIIVDEPSTSGRS